MKLPSFLAKLERIPPRVEVALRITLANFCGFCFAVGAPPRVTPSTTGFLIGIIASVLSVVIPSLLFGIGLAFPAVIVVMTLALIFSSMLLAAATVSDGLLVFIFALYSMWICALRYGPDREKTGGVAGIIVMLAAMMALSFRTLVQDGLTVPLVWPPAGTEDLFPGVKDMLGAICLWRDLPSDCWQDEIPQFDDPTFEVDVSEGIFAGQTATITIDEEASTVFVSFAGGLWWVAGLWTWKGLDNPLANNRNFLITICWALFCVMIGMIMPPFRTVRKAVSRALLPAALNDVKSALGDSIRYPASGNNSNDTTNDADMENIIEGREARIGRLVHYLNTILDGSLAVMTAFEYRLFKAPFECTWMMLKDLMQRTNKLVFVSITIAKWHPTMLKDRQVNRAIENAVTVVEACAKALAVNEEPLSCLDSLKENSCGYGSFKENAPPECAVLSSLFTQKDRLMTVLTQRVLESTIAWQNAMLHPDSPSPCKKQGLKNIEKTYGLSLGAPVLILKKLFLVLAIPFRPDTWNASIFLEFLKYPTGFVALFIMSVYWEGYDNLALDVDNDGASGLYSGWNLIAYTFSWTLTLEGSVKKGIARASSTCLGGFLAWLGIIVCSGSYDLDANINPYGLVAWLTITSGIAAYFTVEPGFAARLGMSKDYGYVGFYFILTQTLCALEVNAGKGGRDDIVVNRIVGNLSGIAVAMILALLPPYTRGGDPRHAREFLMEMVNALADGLDSLLSQQDSDDSTSKALGQQQAQFETKAMEKRRNAQFLFKDAAHLRVIPFLGPDPKLNTEIENMTVTASLICSFFEFASYLSKSAYVVDLLDPSSQYYQELEEAIKELLREKHANRAQDVEMRSEGSEGLKTDEEYVVTLLELLWAILHRLETHDTNLMKFDSAVFLEKFMKN